MNERLHKYFTPEALQSLESQKADRIQVPAQGQQMNQGGNFAPGGWGRTTGVAQVTDVASALVGYAYRCLKVINSQIAKANVTYYHKTAQYEREELEMDHWLVKLMQRPNPFFTQKQMRIGRQQSLQYWGSAYCYFPRFGGDVPMQYHLLDPRRVQILQDPETYIKRYFYLKTVGGYVEIDPTEMLHVREINMSSLAHMLKGYPEIAAAMDALAINAELKQFVNRYFRAEGIPPLVFKQDAQGGADIATNKTVQDQIRSAWNDVLPNNKVAGFMPRGLTVEPISSMSKDVADKLISGNTGESIIKEICTTFGVPVSMIEGEKDAYAGAVQITNNFITQTIMPICDMHGDAETHYFRQFDDTLEVMYDVEMLSDRDYELRVKQALGFVVNEVRSELGMEPVPNGDVYMIPGAYIPLAQAVEQAPSSPAPAATPATAPAPAPPPAPAASLPSTTTMTYTLPAATKWTMNLGGEAPSATYKIADDPFADEEYALDYWQKAASKIDKGAALLRGSLVQSFEKLEETVLANFERATRKRFTKSGAIRKRFVGKDFEGVNLFDVDEFVKEFFDGSEDVLKEIIKSAMTEAIAHVGEDWADLQSEFDKALEKVVAESASKITEPVSTVKSELNTLLSKMSQSSESEIRAAITEKFKQYKDSRVNAIARTTSTASSGAGKKEAWKTVKIKSRWLTQRDGDTRPTHRMADGQVEDATGYFHVGGDRMKSPGTGHAAKENVNCRCTIAPAPNQSKHINAMRKVYSSWCDERAGKELLSGV